MIYRIHHRTSYSYGEPVAVSHHAARLAPMELETQETRDFQLIIDPVPALRKTRLDYFGNRVCFFSIQETHDRLDVSATSTVIVHATTPAATAVSMAWEDVSRMFQDPVSPAVVDPFQFAMDSPMVRRSMILADYARPSFEAGAPLLEAVEDLTKRIYTDFQYDPASTDVETPVERVFEQRRGVCQDFAHLAIACLRSLGLPARYVSGYLVTHPPEGRERLVGGDASHAWFSAYCPEAGWCDFDPTNNVMPGEEHIPEAYGRDFGDVSPLSGILVGGGRHAIRVSVDVMPIG